MKYDPNRKYKKGDLVRITGIRIERLQDITWKDAEKEGVMFNDDEDLWFNYQSEIWDCIARSNHINPLSIKLTARKHGRKTRGCGLWILR